MRKNSNNQVLSETEFNQLCSHYKDSYEIHLASIKQRDRLFYLLLVILALFSLQLASPDIVNSALSSHINKYPSIKIQICLVLCSVSYYSVFHPDIIKPLYKFKVSTIIFTILKS